ncbi:vasoactive intestinal polypeptide receptor-like isoform X3 [Leucoraja erinacea]|uniref:vasoactive intestinal polypeptide receptor-like isoform X3 n=1 Tax=Leucoraja erinaceus TaxID=7782 RepID=UPI00245503B0|nr:vasoactive intestinal polypeptide receptor-like isoform X3 [Leucoraja erinacea]
MCPAAGALLLSCLWTVSAVMIHPDCELLLEIQLAEESCLSDVSTFLLEEESVGCHSMWDNLSCWPAGATGATVVLPCPKVLLQYADRPGNVSRQCTDEGWTELLHSYSIACGINISNMEDDIKGIFLQAVKISYTVGHSLSLLSLSAALVILCLFRVTELVSGNSFICLTIAVLIKDVVLFDSDSDQCTLSTPSCKAAITFFEFSITANFFWLLAEGIYLHTLIVVFFTERKYFWWYIVTAWGVPLLITVSWTLAMMYNHDFGCWDSIDSPYFWIIKAPISLTILVNFILFISIIQILIQKVYSSDSRGSEYRQYMRLAKSTLLLIPLFGVNYIVFVFVPDHLNVYFRLVFDLALGSFQGFIVAILYCFLNGEVQLELGRKWRRWCTQWYLTANSRYCFPSLENHTTKEGTQISMVSCYSSQIQAANNDHADLHLASVQ